MPGISLSLNSTIQTVASSSTGVAVNDAFDVTFVAPLATSLKVQGSSDNGSTYNDIATTAVTGNGTTDAPSVSLQRPRFTHLRPVFSGAGSACCCIRQHLRNQPPASLDKTKNKTIIEPILGVA
jgi:hypothetical protein